MTQRDYATEAVESKPKLNLTQKTAPKTTYPPSAYFYAA
jgi:hypothetical protein